MSRRVPLRLSSSAVIGAGIALVAGGAGFALAGIPDSKGVIHACYSKTDGALRVVKGSKCQSGEKKLKWNQQGRPGATNVKVRSANVRLKYSCFQITPSNYSCTAPATAGTAHCIGAERATGGGYGKPKDGSTPTVTESKPSPAPGTPTAWTVTASAFTSGPTPTHPDTLVPVYAVCAAP